MDRVLEEMLGRRDKAQDKSFAVKTNKAYQAALQEIEGIKEAIKKQEDELLDIMEKTDTLKAQLKKTEEHLKKSRAEHTRTKQQIETDLDRYVQEIEAQKAARLELVAAIKPEVLSNYDKLREAKNGLAVVITKHELCMGCNMKIPPQSYNLVITSDDIIHCPNCRRMLYMNASRSGRKRQAGKGAVSDHMKGKRELHLYAIVRPMVGPPPCVLFEARHVIHPHDPAVSAIKDPLCGFHLFTRLGDFYEMFFEVHQTCLCHS